MDLPILFRDNRFVVLDKPPGLAVHAGPRGGPSVEDCFPALSRRRDGPWLAHRLDADTSGCLVVALRRAALLEAQAAFATGRAEKIYWAVVRGGPEASSGLVDLALRKRSDRTGWRMEPAAPGDAESQRAITQWRVRGRAGGTAWLELRPRTGRTHQIRVHCAALGYPIVGDAIYGAAGDGLQLLARSIRLPVTPPLAAIAPPPLHMHGALLGCGWREQGQGSAP
jgi:tRNA pseudouridine32 synthase/23S rRNA pseudouridine746 synthase